MGEGGGVGEEGLSLFTSYLLKQQVGVLPQTLQLLLPSAFV